MLSVLQALSVQCVRHKMARCQSDRTTLLSNLDLAGVQGATWKTIGQILNLHHGQVSGALSNLHKAGEYSCCVQSTALPCVCVAALQHWAYTDEQVFDTPATTRAGERTALLNDLYATCQTANEVGWSAGMQHAVTTIVNMIAAHDRTT
jgi:hypothetical protein